MEQDVRYPPICAASRSSPGRRGTVQIRPFWSSCRPPLELHSTAGTTAVTSSPGPRPPRVTPALQAR